MTVDTSIMPTCALVAEETVKVAPSQLCGAVKSANKSSATQAEKEAQRVHRVLANREAARQTIRHRQAMHLELTRKVAYLSEENKNLIKEKELVLKYYDSLKARNEFLKLQVASKTNVVPREASEESQSSGAEMAISATTRTPTVSNNQPSLVSFFWPSVVPYPNLFQLQCASHPNFTGLSQFSKQQKDSPSSHLGEEISLENTGRGTALFVLPVPWLLPVLSHSNALNLHSDANRASKDNLSAHQCSTSSPSGVLFVKDNHHQMSNPSMRIEASNSSRTLPVVGHHGAEYTFPGGNDHSTRRHLKQNLLLTDTLNCVRSVESPRPMRHAWADEINYLEHVSAPGHIPHSSLKKNHETFIIRQKKSENVDSALKARRRRKELMRMKNIDNRHFRMHSIGD